ncbi:hypothetical protein [Pseudomonas sp. KCJK9016]|uniref:hypothetical protein n=1 Tax=Pseudomonas sp. KCJK9016 TaxID=3344556 RepID=UPI003906496C
MNKNKYRILIAHPQLAQQIFIEKNLNKLGYYRITTADTHEEAFKLTKVDLCQIDVLVVAEELLMPNKSLDSYDSDGAKLIAKYIFHYPSTGTETTFTHHSSKTTWPNNETLSHLSLCLFMQAIEQMEVTTQESRPSVDAYLSQIILDN